MLSTTIVTLPKPGKSPTVPANFRPLSLLNIDVKLYAKILAERLLHFLPQLIKPDQVGFGRQAPDGTRRFRDLIQKAKKDGAPSLLLAFDRVHWSHLDSLLDKFGVGPVFKSAILALYSHPSARVLSSGFLSDTFRISNGTRQGCPLSPIIFALVMEPLAESIQTNGNIGGITVGRQHHKIGLYADDIILAMTSPSSSLSAPTAALENFGRVSYYKVNSSKSQILPIVISPPLRRDLSLRFPYQWNVSRITYLGISLTAPSSDLFAANYVPLLTRVSSLLTAFSRPMLSWASRISIVKMMALPLVLYLFRTVAIPSPDSHFPELQEILSDFIWEAGLVIHPSPGLAHLPIFDNSNVLLQVGVDNRSKDLEENDNVEDEDMVYTPNVHPGHHSTDPSYNPPNHEEPSHQPQIVTTSTRKKGGERFQWEGGKEFNKSSDLLTQRRSQPGDEPSSCSEHGEYFKDKSNVVTYERSHTEEKSFICPECGTCFSNKSNLEKHEKIHTGEKPYSRPESENSFISKAKLNDHQRSHTGEKPYSCAECGKCFQHKSSLTKHQRKHKGEKPYSCSECEKSYISKYELNEHQRSHTGEKPYSCAECGKCFQHRTNFTKHQRTHKGEKPYSCSECGKCFMTKYCFIVHQRTHTGEKPYSCSECGQCFIDGSKLIRHQRIHTGEKPYSCSECGKCFVDKSRLLAHQDHHIGVKPYSCFDCKKSFRTKHSFIVHQRSHTGEKPYSCSECGKCFTAKAQLVRHQRIHTGEKRYLCSECGKCFIDKSNLTKHQRIHTGEKPYSCAECGKCFTDLSAFGRHKRFHTEEKPYQ
ncbi:uncharacterized protein RB166_005838 [Leptodactylus fuscus]